MKLVMITYNEAIDQEVMGVLRACAMKNYTKAIGAYGKGTSSGTHMGDDIWPGRNNILYVACDEAQARQMLGCVRALRAKLGQEGVKAFVLPLEEMT
jgi:hypothetical protein